MQVSSSLLPLGIIRFIFISSLGKSVFSLINLNRFCTISSPYCLACLAPCYYTFSLDREIFSQTSIPPPSFLSLSSQCIYISLPKETLQICWRKIPSFFFFFFFKSSGSKAIFPISNSPPKPSKESPTFFKLQW